MEQNSLNILLVDDDEFFSTIVASQLEDEYLHKVKVVDSGNGAIEALQKGNIHFDIILTDYNMPEMNGIELLKWIKSQNIETPVVMLTAAGSDVVAVEAMKLGAYDYVRKEQLDIQHLGVVINGTFERYQFRIAKALEEERTREIALNKLATDKVRDVLNAITPALNSALANINSDIETKGEEIYKSLPLQQREELRSLLKNIQRETVSLETSIRGLLGLYRILYAHHAEVQEIERLKQEIEQKSEDT